MRAISATLMLAVCLGLAACERAAEEPSAAAAAGAPAATSIKATQAMDLINAEVEPMIWDSATQGGRDRGTLEIELHSLEGPWRWWSRQRRVMSDGQIWWGLFADVTFSVAPEDLAIPVTVTQGAEDRWDVVVSCRSGTCFRMSGSEATGEGTLEQVEVALNAPSPTDRQIDAVYFPFRTQDQADRVATAMNELLALQGAQPATTATTTGEPR